MTLPAKQSFKRHQILVPTKGLPGPPEQPPQCGEWALVLRDLPSRPVWASPAAGGLTVMTSRMLRRLWTLSPARTSLTTTSVPSCTRETEQSRPWVGGAAQASPLPPLLPRCSSGAGNSNARRTARGSQERRRGGSNPAGRPVLSAKPGGCTGLRRSTSRVHVCPHRVMRDRQPCDAGGWLQPRVHQRRGPVLTVCHHQAISWLCECH